MLNFKRYGQCYVVIKYHDKQYNTDRRIIRFLIQFNLFLQTKDELWVEFEITNRWVKTAFMDLLLDSEKMNNIVVFN